MTSVNQTKQGKVNEVTPTMIRMYNVREYYKILQKVGRGTYGTVYKAKGTKDGRYYAIKKLQNNDSKLQQQGFPITALREITLLKQIDHPNIIKLKEIIVSRPNKRNQFRGSTFLVFEYMDHDFAGLFKMKNKYSLSEIKCIIKQLLQGVAYLHRHKILHRDIKSANILLNDEGDVKLADFGLGRKVRLENVFTYKVVTLWYRAPQLILGLKTYTDKIDVWSIGCVVAQFFTGEVLFKKQAEYAQIQRIYEIVGDFQDNGMKVTEEWAKMYANLQDFGPRKPYKKEIASYLKKNCPSISQITIDFIQGLLHLNPSKRMSCEQALRHPFFSEKPLACNKEEIQKMQFECHELFRDRSIKIQRIEKRDSQLDERHYKNKDNREVRIFREGKHYPEREHFQRKEKEIEERRYHRNFRDNQQYKNRQGMYKTDRHYQNRRHGKYHSSEYSSPQPNSRSFSSSSYSSQYSGSQQSQQSHRSPRSRSRYDSHHRRIQRRSREQRKDRDDYSHRQHDERRYPRREQKYNLKPERIGRESRDQKYYHEREDQRFKTYRGENRKRVEGEGRKQDRDDRQSTRKDDKKYERRDEKKMDYDQKEQRRLDRPFQRKTQKREERREDKRQEKRSEIRSQKREERRSEKREDQKEVKRDDREEKRDYRERKQSWVVEDKQKKHEKYERGSLYQPKDRRHYQQKDYKRRQQRKDQKYSRVDKSKYQDLQKQVDYVRREQVGEKRDKFYFVSGKNNQFRKKDHGHSHSSERSSPQLKKDKDYRRKPYHFERNQRKHYYKKQHQGSDDRRNH